MAKIVFGAGASHGPQMNTPSDYWHLLRLKDETDPRLPYQALLEKADQSKFAKLITPEKMRESYTACHKANAVLVQKLAEVSPDVVIMIGDDQHELFLNDNSPMFSVYRGAKLTGRKRAQKEENAIGFSVEYTKYQDDFSQIDQLIYPGYPELADHMIKSMIKDGFDLAVADQRGEQPAGLGHAYMYLYQRLLSPEQALGIPMVPVFINTFYPPNQAPLQRCYDLGLSVKKAVESWGEDKRVAIVFSGGLSHVILDEELDWTVINGIKNKDRFALCALPEEELINGSSEIRTWIACAAALIDLDMTLVDYIPAYRSLAGTGCGMGYAYWS